MIYNNIYLVYIYIYTYTHPYLDDTGWHPIDLDALPRQVLLLRREPKKAPGMVMESLPLPHPDPQKGVRSISSLFQFNEPHIQTHHVPIINRLYHINYIY